MVTDRLSPLSKSSFDAGDGNCLRCVPELLGVNVSDPGVTVAAPVLLLFTVTVTLPCGLASCSRTV